MDNSDVRWDLARLTTFVAGGFLRVEGAPTAMARALDVLGPHAARVDAELPSPLKVAAFDSADEDGLSEAWRCAGQRPGTVSSHSTRLLIAGRWQPAEVAFLNLLDHELEVMVAVTRFVGDAVPGPADDAQALVPGTPASWMLLRTDRDGTIAQVDGTTSTLVGRSADDLVGTRIDDIVHPDDRCAAAASRERAITIAGASRSLRHRFRRVDGSSVWVEATVTFDAAADQLQIMVVDIERQRAERAALEASHVEIHELAEEFRLLAEEVPTGAFRADANGRIRFANGRFRALAGGHDVESLQDLATPSDAWIVDDALARVRSGNDDRGPRRDGVQFEFSGRVDGQPLSLRISAAQAAHGQRPSVVGILIDGGPAAELRALARTDALTGLLNREALCEHVDIALTAGTALCVMFIDFDRFKHVNDRHGHHAGDEVLRVVARRLRNAVRETEEVGRLGGDEFVVVCKAAEDETIANLRARIEAVLSEPVHFDDSLWQPEASIGLARCSPGDDAISLLRRADAEMYRTKRDKALRRSALDRSEDPETGAIGTLDTG